MIVTAVVLVLFLAKTEDYTDIRMVDKFDKLETCNKVISKINEDEQKHPDGNLISHKLGCIVMSIDIEYKLIKGTNKPVEPIKYECKPRVILGKTIKCLST